MRILILSWRDIKHKDSGGAEVVTFEHARAWVKAGHEVVWFASTSPGNRKKETIEGIKVIRKGSILFTVHLAAFFWYLKNGRGRFDLVVDQFHGIPFLSPLYVKEKKIAFIHEVTKEVWLLNPLGFPLNYIFGITGHIIEPFIFKLFYRRIPFLTVSESTKKDLICWGIKASNISVIHNGIRAQIPKLIPEKEKIPTIIFLGALARDKGIEEAIKAFGLINQKKGHFQFWVVGGSDRSYLRKLQRLVQKCGLNGQVKFWGFVSGKKKFELLARTHILINPSIREGWGLVNIEANLVGTPVIAYNSPGLRDSVINNRTGIICHQNTPGDLANEAANLLKHKWLYGKLQRGALEWSKQFDWRLSAMKSLRLIEKIVKK